MVSLTGIEPTTLPWLSRKEEEISWNKVAGF